MLTRALPLHEFLKGEVEGVAQVNVEKNSEKDLKERSLKT